MGQSVQRREFGKTMPAVGTGLMLMEHGAPAGQTEVAPPAEGGESWHSPSLTMETVTAPNGAVTAHAAQGHICCGASRRGRSLRRSPTACTPCRAGASQAATPLEA